MEVGRWPTSTFPPPLLCRAPPLFNSKPVAIDDAQHRLARCASWADLSFEVHDDFYTLRRTSGGDRFIVGAHGAILHHAP